MKLNIEFLQTGGVPLTNDLMASIMEAIKLYDAVGSLAGHMTIIAGCDPVSGSTTTVHPGVVAINDEVLYFEGGLIDTNVFIYEQDISKTFQDQTSKILVKKRTVKFGNATPPNSFPWLDFVKLKTIKEIQQIALAAATQSQVTDLSNRILQLEILTAPIKTKKIRWFFEGDIADIPAGWEIDTNMQGFVPIGVDPTDINFDAPGKKFGTKKHPLTEAEMPAHSHNMPNQIVIQSAGKANSDAFHRVSPGYVNRNTDSRGGNQPHNNIQPSIAGYWIKPI
jgi:hypothetical protein